MKKQLLNTLFAPGAFFSTGAEANTDKNINIGLAAYALTIAYDDAFTIDDDYSGTGISALYAISNSVAFRGTWYAIEPGLISWARKRCAFMIYTASQTRGLHRFSQSS